jgi:chromosome segregation protein
VGVQQSRIRQLEESMAQSAQRIEQLVRELRDLDTSTFEAEREAGEARVLELEDINRSWQERAEEARARIEAGRRDINTRGGELDELRGDLREQRGRFASLGALQQAALGQGDEKVSGWIAAQALSSASRLAERVTVDAGWDAAVETVLGRHLEAICVPDIDALAPSLALFGEGTLGLFSPLSTQGAVIRPGSLLAKVRADFDLGGLLGGVLAASTLEEALALRAGLGAGESVITHDGIWLGRDWLRVARDADPRAGVIRRAAELTELGTSIDTLREREAGLLGALEEARESLRAAEEGLVVLQQEQRAAAARYTEARSALSACAVRLEQMELRASRNRDEQQQYRERHESQRTSLQEARGILETALDAMHQDTQRREELQDARERARVALDAARSRSRESRESAHRLAMRRESLTAQIEALRAAIVRITGQFNTLEDRSRHLGEQIAATAMPIAEGKATLEGQLGRRLEVERELQSARAAVQGVEHELRESEKLRHATAQEAESARSVLERERLALQSVQVRIEGVLEQLERTGAVLPEVLQSLPPEAEEQAWQAQIERLAAQIARLGPINLAAIDEHRAQSERKTYLDAQNADLVEALDTLENAIRKIDRETRTRFKETFDKVNSGLQELFPRVFGGGHAYLELTGEDLLDTGVTIMARPPGKRNATIHLLSGGEKALTAISLVFSIFRLNPSPFCMLDEVDAPLDDANVGRFTRLVKEMSEQVQFIVITHNKITMEMAQHLMGVTMQEPGVSRLVSVDVDEAVALAEIA